MVERGRTNICIPKYAHKEISEAAALAGSNSLWGYLYDLFKQRPNAPVVPVSKPKAVDIISNREILLTIAENLDSLSGLVQTIGLMVGDMVKMYSHDAQDINKIKGQIVDLNAIQHMALSGIEQLCHKPGFKDLALDEAKEISAQIKKRQGLNES